MNLRTLCLILGLSIGGVAGVSALKEQQAHAENAQTGELSLEEIAAEMAKKDCEEILSARKNIEYVQYDGRSNNFDELVYQRNVPVKDRLPVVVLWYQQDKEIAKKSAVVFKQWAKVHEKDFKFVAFEADIDPNLAAGNYSGLARTYGLKTLPSFGLYHTKDYVKKNDFQGVKQIDIWRGGPQDNNTINRFIRIANKHWLPTNVTNPNGEWVRRTQNTLPNRWYKLGYDSK